MKKMTIFARCKRLVEIILVLTAVLYICELRVSSSYINFLEILPYELKGGLLPINMILGVSMLYIYYWDSKQKILKTYMFMAGICLLINIGHIIGLVWLIYNYISKVIFIQCIINICILMIIVGAVIFLLINVKIEMDNIRCGKTEKYTSEDNYPNKSNILLGISVLDFFMIIPFCLYPLWFWPYVVPILMAVILLNNKIRRGKVSSAILIYVLLFIAVIGFAFGYGVKGVYHLAPAFIVIFGVCFTLYVLLQRLLVKLNRR